jgi:hypothetical protein
MGKSNWMVIGSAGSLGVPRRRILPSVEATSAFQPVGHQHHLVDAFLHPLPPKLYSNFDGELQEFRVMSTVAIMDPDMGTVTLCSESEPKVIKISAGWRDGISQHGQGWIGEGHSKWAIFVCSVSLFKLC